MTGLSPTKNPRVKHTEENFSYKMWNVRVYSCRSFCTGKNRVVKITRSSSEMVLRTIKHTMIYISSGPSLKVVVLHLVV
jgi:hypothetical protein